MAIGDALVGTPSALPVIPPAPPATPIPPTDPASVMAQLQAYRNAFANMPNDPSMSPALTQFGFNLLQPVRPGDSPGGVLSRAGTQAVDYYQQLQGKERAELFNAMNAGLAQRASDINAAQAAEGVAASAQRRGVEAARAPVDIATAQTAYEKAKADLDLIKQEEAAGIRSADFLARKAKAEVGVREALSKMYEAHSKYYGDLAKQLPQKNQRQTLNVKTVENADGTTSLISTIVVNGQPYQQVFTPPRFSDPAAATAAAQKQVDKETPSAWNFLAGKPPYQGTAAEEVARRAKAFMEPQLITIGPDGRQISNEQFQQLGVEQLSGPQGGPAPGPTPSPAGFPKETQGQATEALGRSVAIIKGELADARKAGNAPLVASLEKELTNAAQTAKGIGKYPQPQPSAPTEFVRDAQGNIVPSGGAPAATKSAATAPAPAAAPTPQNSPYEAAGVKVDQARAQLATAQRALRQFTVRAQKEDPQGYLAALTAVAQAQEAVATATNEYQRVLGPAGQGVPGMVLRPSTN